MPLFLLFILIPVVELTVFLKVSGSIGVFWTVMMVLFTAMVGVTLLRRQGLATLMRAGQKMQAGQLPAQELAEGFLLALGGALLITPGFVTDSIGFSLLVPMVRQMLVGSVIKMIQGRMVSGASNVGQFGQGFEQKPTRSSEREASRTQHNSRQSGQTIEGEFKREDD